jgi:hypothetical protein
MSTFLAVFVTDTLFVLCTLAIRFKISFHFPLLKKKVLEQRHKISQQSQTQNMPRKWHKKARSLSSVAAAAMAFSDEHEGARHPPARLCKSG